MPPSHPWNELELAGPAPAREIKRAYARLVKIKRPDDDPEAFQALHAAYQWAMALAEQAQVSEPSPASTAALDTPPQPSTGQPAQPLPVPPDEADLLQAQLAKERDDWLALGQRLAERLKRWGDQAPSAEEAEALTAEITALIDHPANLTLANARHTEGFLLEQAAHSNHWPAAALSLLMVRYNLSDRLAFDRHGVSGRIAHLLERAEQSQHFADVARQNPKSLEAMLCKPPTWRLRWALLRSPQARAYAAAALEWLQHNPQPIVHADAQRVAENSLVLAQQVARARLPFVALTASGTLIGLPWLATASSQDEAAVLATIVVLAMAAAAALVGLLGYFALPLLRRAQHESPVRAAAAEPVLLAVVMLCFLTGGVAPLWLGAVGSAAGLTLMAGWAAQGRSDSGAALMMWTLSAVAVSSLTMPLAVDREGWLLWPLAPLAWAAACLRSLPAPPIVLSVPSNRIMWRSGQAWPWRARAVLLGMLAVALAWYGLAFAMGEAYSHGAWPVLGLLVILLGWQVVGFAPLLSWADRATEYRIVVMVILLCAWLAGIALASAPLAAPQARVQAGLLMLIAAQAVSLLWALRKAA